MINKKMNLNIYQCSFLDLIYRYYYCSPFTNHFILHIRITDSVY